MRRNALTAALRRMVLVSAFKVVVPTCAWAQDRLTDLTKEQLLAMNLTEAQAQDAQHDQDQVQALAAMLRTTPGVSKAFGQCVKWATQLLVKFRKESYAEVTRQADVSESVFQRNALLALRDASLKSSNLPAATDALCSSIVLPWLAGLSDLGVEQPTATLAVGLRGAAVVDDRVKQASCFGNLDQSCVMPKITAAPEFGALADYFIGNAVMSASIMIARFELQFRTPIPRI